MTIDTMIRYFIIYAHMIFLNNLNINYANYVFRQQLHFLINFFVEIEMKIIVVVQAHIHNLHNPLKT